MPRKAIQAAVGYPIPKSTIKTKISPKKAAFVIKCNAYYLEAITDNIERNDGVCRCDECNEPISHPRGVNVCHIVGGGALKGENGAIYLDKRNNFILGKGFPGQCRCGIKFDDMGEKETMKIYPRYVEIRATLNFEYYNS